MHSHIGKVLEWGLDENTNFVGKLYGCLTCDETSEHKWEDVDSTDVHTHTKYVEGCFACKLPTLHLGTGDATSGIPMTKKALNKELGLYREARAQGIQPKSTKTKDIQRAIDASNKVGVAYDASKV